MPETADFDHEFLTAGNPAAEGEKLEALIQQNLSPEEQAFIEKVTPIVSQFMDLIAKAQGGEENVSINGQEQGMMTPPAMGVAQNTNNAQVAPLQAVEEQMPKVALGGAQKVVPAEESGQMAAAGPVGVVNTRGADDSGVADDVPTESDGFIINAAAVRKVGVREIYNLIEEAMKYLEEKGVNLDTSKVPVDAEKILVSKGEIIIPDVIAAVIGYDKLEEINALGTDETKEMLAEQQQRPTKPPIIEAAEGVNLQEENVVFPGTDTLIPEHTGEREKLLPRDEQLNKMQQEIEVNKILDEKKIKPSQTDFVPTEVGDVKPTPIIEYFGYTPDKLYDATAKYEWRGDTPKFGFVKTGTGFSTSGKSSAFGPVQIVKRTLTDPEFVKRLSQTQQDFVNTITAAQTLNINLQTFKGSASRSVSTEEGPKGREALKVLGITPQQFIKFVKDGYFLPSNKTEQEVGIPPDLLPENYEGMYREIYKKVLELKSEREDSSTLEGLL